jgi:hypothetical protein
MAYRLFWALATRHNFFRPWWIPLRMIAELHGLVWAIGLARRGPHPVFTAAALVAKCESAGQ